MDIQGFYSYINEKCRRLFDSYELNSRKRLIVDIRSISRYLFNESQRKNVYSYFGADYKKFYTDVENFFQRFLENNIEMLVIFNGCWESHSRNLILEHLNNDIAENYEFFVSGKRTIRYTPLNDTVVLDVIKKLNIQYLIYTFESDKFTATIGKLLRCPILTANSDFFLYRSDYIPYSSLVFNGKKITAMVCKPDRIPLRFALIDCPAIPLLAVLCGRNYFSDDLLANFFNHFPPEKKYHPSVKLDDALRWLSTHSLQSAAQSILSLMMNYTEQSLESSKKDIRRIVNHYSQVATYMIDKLGELSSFAIDQSTITKAQSEQIKFKFSDDDESDDDEDAETMKQKFADSVPSWLLDDYSAGKFDACVIGMMRQKSYISWQKPEDFDYPSIYEICIPLIATIYELVISCLSADQLGPLELVIRRGNTVHYTKIKVEYVSNKLEELRKLGAMGRIFAFNDMVGIHNPTGLEDLPENWRLFVITAVYWMKQDDEVKKHENYLHALLLSILFSLITKNIDDTTDYWQFTKNFNKKIQAIEHKKIGKIQNDNLSIAEAIKLISDDDILIATKYYLSLFKKEVCFTSAFYIVGVSYTNRKEINMTSIHVYSQFQSCFEFCRNINGLLDCPYPQTPIHEIFNGPMMYNVYADITQKSTDIDTYVANQLKCAPNIRRVFQLLKKKVEGLLK